MTVKWLLVSLLAIVASIFQASFSSFRIISPAYGVAMLWMASVIAEFSQHLCLVLTEETGTLWLVWISFLLSKCSSSSTQFDSVMFGYALTFPWKLSSLFLVLISHMRRRTSPARHPHVSTCMPIIKEVLMKVLTSNGENISRCSPRQSGRQNYLEIWPEWPWDSHFIHILINKKHFVTMHWQLHLLSVQRPLRRVSCLRVLRRQIGQI